MTMASQKFDTTETKLPHSVSGVPPAKNVPALFFLPGFPDDVDSFEEIASRYR